MRILDRKSFSPIRLAPGDSLSLEYAHPFLLGKKRKLLHTYTFTEAMTVNECVIVKYSPAELRQLKLKDAIGMVIGDAS